MPVEVYLAVYTIASPGFRLMGDKNTGSISSERLTETHYLFLAG